MTTAVKLPSWSNKLAGTLYGWQRTPMPDTPRLTLPQCRDELAAAWDYDWGPSAGRSTRAADVARMPRDGVANGTPMQLGHPTATRILYWGGGYGKHESNRATIPRPFVGAYWVTGHPVPMFDRRCIISGPDGVHELIQFDQGAPRRAAGLPQQALGWGLWLNGQLVDGRAVTASRLPSHRYIWTPRSAQQPHQQGLTLNDYQGGDGTLTTGPRCGDWVVLDRDSDSYRRMAALGGECHARAEALARYGARITDRGGSISVLTQAGAYWSTTNNHLFTIALADLRFAT
jgi:hypothetical protein